MVRRKQRYLLLQVDAEGKALLGEKDLTERLKESVRVLFGDFHAGLVQWSLKVIYHRQETGLAVLRCERMHTKLLETTLALFTSGSRHDIRIKVVRVFGSIESCRKGILSLTQKRLDSFGADYGNQLRSELEEEIKNAELG
uniref:Ribonuclease P/MRP protein subunit POP5 n=1 Tax=Albugo laibachii Nc14 TaxID=890382 RepID=F0VZ20_9STRA|nr:conserved hypothetical protein [Albugo laibachii Nc14]|eukprot:CCA14035.1 conserved hypothetical protein [Albugo laibachii Nc14]